MKRNSYGDMANTHVLLPPTAISGITPISVTDDMTQHDGVGLILVTTGTVAGAWTFQGINGFRGSTGMNNSQSAAGQSADVTALASPAVPNPAGSPTAKATQFSVFMWGALGVTFTPTSGSGTVAIYRFKKGTS